MINDILIVLAMLAVVVVLVVVHELGHFFVARRNGVKPEEFGIFFPPKLWSRKTKKGWIFSINALPVGGFVRLKGEFDSDNRPHSFGAARLGAKTKILLAGVTMNVVIAFILLTVLAWIGLPQLLNNQFQIKSDSHIIQKAQYSVIAGEIETGSPAAAAGIKVNDTLVSIGPANNLMKISRATALPTTTADLAGQTVEINYIHGGIHYSRTITLRSKAEIVAAQAQHIQEGYLGVAVNEIPSNVELKRSTWSAPVVAAGVMIQYTATTFQALGSVFHGIGSIIAGTVTHNHAAREVGQTQANQLSGPIGIFKLLKAYASLGPRFTMWLIAIVSLSLAIVNVLPIPPLDGGKLFMILLARLRHHRLSKDMELLANSIGLLFFLVVFILISISDVYKQF